MFLTAPNQISAHDGRLIILTVNDKDGFNGRATEYGSVNKRPVRAGGARNARERRPGRRDVTETAVKGEAGTCVEEEGPPLIRTLSLAEL